MSRSNPEKHDVKITKDGLENLVAQLGTEQDKRSHSTFVNNKHLSDSANRQELDAMYRTDWVSGKVVDIIPDDMTREWRSFIGDEDPEIIKIITKEEERLQLRHHVNWAHKLSRLYGTSFIVMDIDDGKTPDKPLNLNAIREGGLRHIKVIDRHRMFHTQSLVENPLDPNFGFPEYYTPVGTTINIHASRLIRFDAVMLPFDEFGRANYWSDSILDRLYDAISNFLTVHNASASMVFETNVDVHKIKNFMSMLQTPEGEKLLLKRFTLANMMKSFNNALLLDSEEEHDIKNRSFSGIPDIMREFANVITAASDIPATRLLGSSASGLNATGEGDLKNYYDKIASLQENEYRPKLSYFDNIMLRSLGLNPEDGYEFEFNSLFQMTDQEQADLELKNAQRDTVYLDQGVVKASTVAKELQQLGTYTNLTDEDIKEIEKLEEEADDNIFATDPEPTNNFEQEEEGEGEAGEASENTEDS